MNNPILTVSQLNRFVKSLIEGDGRLSDLLLQGEISNLHFQQRSGHLYFTLKDGEAAVRAVMFRGNARFLPFTPQDGMAVILRCSVSLYERDGAYQVYVRDMQPDGLGSLHLAFEQLKGRLQQEGLFDAAHKKPLPRFPNRIGVITSADGAALQDVLNILSRRYPLATVVLCPVLVQGQQAAGQLAQAVKQLDAKGDCDLLLIGRGGGSLEDLWAFNDERLARVIYSCRTPVISAVGHETDYTICDFVADLRAPTPSAAAEQAVPNQQDLRYALFTLQEQLQAGMTRRLEQARARLARCSGQNLVDLQQRRLRMHGQQLRLLVELIRKAGDSIVPRRRERLSALAAVADALSPLHTLGRGYALLLREGRPLTRAAQIAPGEEFTARLQDGSLRALVQSVELGEGDKP